ncbi:MAG: PilZ domain-containing protein [Clostridia bacterium]|nr:PilZ domain-containing protein [Clostridia bacterium]
MSRSQYLILDNTGTPLASGELQSSITQRQFVMVVAEEDLPRVVAHDEVQLLGGSDSEPAVLARIVRVREDRVFFEKIRSLGAEARENFRLAVSFRSFIYPLTGGWKGRREIESIDLSCGGIAFYCAEELVEGEELEVVVPVTAEPTILRCRVIRRRPSEREVPVYACGFVDLCDDEETLVREAVFSLQVRSR